VPSEYLTGPSYNLSENDLVAFEAALERCKSASEGKLSVVGFYRSHTRDELYMDDADLKLARRFFPEPGNVFLLVRPFASRPCIGGFFFWEDGEIYRESTYLQFPFERRELGGGEPRQEPPPPPRSAQPEAPPLPPYTPAVERQPVRLTAAEEPLPAKRTSSLSILSAPDEPAQTSSKLEWRWLIVPGFLAIAGVGGIIAYRNLDNAKASANLASTDPLPLKLSVSERKNQLDVTWDRNAPAVTRAKRGVLSIADGANRRDLELSAPQLRNGKVLYTRLSGDVNLRMEVFPEGQASVVESLRVVSTEAPEPQAPRRAVVDRPAAAKKQKNVDAPEAPRIPTRPAPSSPGLETAPKTPVVQPPAQPEVELQRPARRR
jgi:hypothetical protein